MAEGYPVFLSLKSWVFSDSLFDSMLMVPFHPNPVRFTSTVVSELMSKPLLTIEVYVDVFLVVLCHHLLRVPCVVTVEATHISTITKVNTDVRLGIIDIFT